MAAGFRYMLTDDDMDVDQSLPGSAPVSVNTRQDDLSATLTATVSFLYNAFSLEVTYAGEYSEDTTVNTGLLRVGFMF